MSSTEKKVTKSGVQLSKAGEAYLADAKAGRCDGFIMTSHEGTTHRIDIQHITPDQLQLLKAKRSNLVK